MKSNSILTYLIIEDALNVCEGILERMKDYPLWECVGVCQDIVTAHSALRINLPALIFMDWDIRGGSTFELLNWIQNTEGYSPYVIYFTGFQSDEPSIPVDIHNKYHVDKYLIKPIWNELSLELDKYVDQAEQKAKRKTWYSFRTENQGYVQIPLNDIVYVAVFDPEKRTKSIYLKSRQSYLVRMTFDELEEIFLDAGIPCIRPNRKFSIVNPKYIKAYQRPEIFLHHTNHTLTVSSDNLSDFENYRKQFM